MTIGNNLSPVRKCLSHRVEFTRRPIFPSWQNSYPFWKGDGIGGGEPMRAWDWR